MSCCKLEWKDNFYSEEFLKSVDYGCYNPNTFSIVVVDGVRGSYVSEGVCPVHGVVCSRLGGLPDPNKQTYPCGAYKSVYAPRGFDEE